MKKMKKCLSFILAIVLLVTSVPLNGFVGLEWPDLQLPEWNLPEIDFGNLFSITAKAATSGTCGKSLTWTLDDDGILTISGTGAMKHYDSGEEVPWYNSRSNIKEIIIEEGATNVGSYAFSDCASLIKVTLPNGVKSINYHSFYNCSALESITIPDTVKIVGSYGFKNCTALKTVIIGDNSNLEAIYEGAFSGCVMLNTITLPSCVEDIEEEVFQDCSSLISITIPASIRILENSVFQGCSALQSVSFRENSELIKIEKSAFRDCASLTSISLPSSMENIGESAFRNCSALTSIDLPTSISSIGDYAFYECVSLVSITIPSMMTSIKERTFYGCTSLTSITIPDGITIIGYGAFEKCTSLNAVSMPTSVTTVGSAAFMECITLKTIYVPDTVEYIGMYAFDDTAYYNDQNNWKNGVLYINNHLIKAINLSGAYSVKDGTKTIASYAFWCPALISINLPDSTEFVNDAAFDSCPLLSSINVSEKNVAFSSADGVLYNKSKTALLYYSRGKTDSSFIVPKSVTCIGESAFCNCDKLCSIIITENVLSIEYAAFMNCTNLRSVIFFKNSKLTSIGKDAFFCCTSLRSISIPSNVTRIESYAFGGCSSLTSVSMLNNVTHIENAAFYLCYSMTSVAIPETVTFIGNSAFGECSSLTDVYYGGSSEKWKKVQKGSGNWTLTGVENFHYNSNYLPSTEAGNCGENLIYILDDDGILTIFGIGSMDDYSDENPAPWSANSKYIKKVVIEDGVNNIGNYAFDFCRQLESVEIADSVTNIGDCAFSYCDALSSITIPTNVKSIGKQAFDNCQSLSRIEIPETVMNIGDWAFCNCSAMTDIVVLGNNDAFSAVDGVLYNKDKSILICYPAGKADQKFEIPHTVETIATWAFCDCKALKSIDIPYTITSITDGAFYECSSLNTISLTPSITTIGKDAFYGCESLKSFTIPVNVESIGDAAFAGCSNLTVFEVATGNKKYSVKEGVLYNNNQTELVCYPLGKKDTSFEIPEQVAHIGNYAFFNNTTLTSIKFPETLTHIGSWAFAHVLRIKSVIIPLNVKNIEDYAFYNCICLSDVFYTGNYSNWKAINIGAENIINESYVTHHLDFCKDIINTYTYKDIGIQGYTYTYNDNYFHETTATKYNHNLAIMSFCLALSAMLNGDFYEDQELPLSDTTITNELIADNFLFDIGFKNCEYYGYETTPTNDSIACVIANKKVGDSTVIAIGIRGAGYKDEWAGNVTLGTTGNGGTETTHEGFNRAKAGVLRYLERYIEDNNINGNVKFWVTGYSRAAATANLVAAELDNGATDYAEIHNLTYKQDDVYAYTFETPRNTRDVNAKNDCYKNIFNLLNCIDVVPKVAPEQWDYVRYGIDYYLPSAETNSNYSTYVTDILNVYDKILCEEDESVVAIEDIIKPGGNFLQEFGIVGSITPNIVFESVIEILAEELIDGTEDYVATHQSTIQKICIDLMGNDTDIIAGFRSIILNYPAIVPIFGMLVVLLFDILDIDLSYVDFDGLLLDFLPAKLLDSLIRAFWYMHNFLFNFAWVAAVDENALTTEENGTYTVGKINCPVDVQLYDENGELLAEMIGDEVTISEDCYMSIYIDADGQKCFYLPKDGQYSFVITGNGEGTMSCSFSTYDFTIGETTEVVNYYDLPVQPGQEYYVSVDKKLFDGSEEDESLANKVEMTNQEDEVIDADEVLTDEDAIELTVTLENESENSYAIGGGTYYKGEYVVLSAIAAENETFLGWYMDGELVSNETSYRFRPDADCTIVAKWEVAETDDFTLGDVDGDGQITSSDARTALRAAVGLDELTENQQKAADADKNGEITSADARLILRAAVGLESLE